MKRDENLQQTKSGSIAHWLRMALIWGFVVTFVIVNETHITLYS